VSVIITLTMQRSAWFIFLVFLLQLCSGCDRQITPEFRPTPTTQASKTPRPTATVFHPTPSATSTKAPTYTSLPPSITPLPETATFTPFPRLSDQEISQNVEQLIRTNGGCDFPCLWGITPGETPWDETVNWLRQFRSEPGNNSEIISRSRPDLINIDFIFIRSNLVVDSILIKARSYGAIRILPGKIAKLWDYYSLKEIIAHFGTPSRVVIATNTLLYGDRGKITYTMWVIYQPLGILVRYEGSLPYAATYHFCPAFGTMDEITDFSIVLQSPQEKTPIEEKEERWNDELARNYFVRKDFQDATSKTLDEFAQLFSQTGVPACFDTPRKIWDSN
jgi:hypothetical protein